MEKKELEIEKLRILERVEKVFEMKKQDGSLKDTVTTSTLDEIRRAILWGDKTEL